MSLDCTKNDKKILQICSKQQRKRNHGISYLMKIQIENMCSKNMQLIQKSLSNN